MRRWYSLRSSTDWRATCAVCRQASGAPCVYPIGHSPFSPGITDSVLFLVGLPANRDELERCITGMGGGGGGGVGLATAVPLGNCTIFKSKTDTHLTTDYDAWWHQTEPRRIGCFQSLRYEPYLVVPHLDSTPPFDEGFVGYGKNKIQWLQHLRLRGFEFWVMPRAFVVHVPHRMSMSRARWWEFKAKKDRLFQNFIRAHAANASVSTPMCRHQK